jgi:hypothetical protein
MLIALIFLLSFSPLSFSKVIPPNYNFNFTELEIFAPDKDFQVIAKKFPKNQIIEIGDTDGIKKLLIKVIAKHYSYDVLLHTYQNKNLDFFVRLPSYFLHDFFHQDILDKFGKQTEYKKIKKTGIYRWEKNGVINIYKATCTITCFPIAFTAYKKKYLIEKFVPFAQLINF